MDNEELLRSFLSLGLTKEKTIYQFGNIFNDWNSKVNLISRKDIDNLYVHHILHSLAIVKIINFEPNTRVVDVGTGGGFPGLPLSIIFPKVHFCLLDSITKKINALKSIVDTLKLNNIKLQNIRSENYFPKDKYDFVIGRGVSSIDQFYKLTKHLISNSNQNSLKNGIIYLTGGNVELDLKNLNLPFKIYNIYDYFPLEYFKTKKIIYLNIFNR